MVVSGTRCLLSYIVLPYLLPVLGWADLVGPALGLAISVVAIGFNVLSIRRLRQSDHRLKWPVGAINAAVIVLMGYLAAGDIIELAG